MGEKIKADRSEPVFIPNNLYEYALGKNGDFAFWRNDFTNIKKFYKIYRKGVKFNTEGNNGDYVPSQKKYKMSANLVNKTARFLFADRCDIEIDKRSDSQKITKQDKKTLTNIFDYVEEVFAENNFWEELLKSAKDAMIGKRIAIMANFSEQSGVDLVFFNSLQFMYDLDLDTNELNMFMAFKRTIKSSDKDKQRFLCKKYTREWDGKKYVVYLEERLYDGAGNLKDTPFKRSPVKLEKIPVKIVLNDGLVGEEFGESDIAKVMGYEEVYSKLSNADIDAQRKTMNPVTYTIDMDVSSTNKLPRSPGSYWDLVSDSSHPNTKPDVGTIESTMAYSEALDLSLSRIKDSAFEELEVPNITSEMLKGNVTTGKALKAIYWPLIVRCKEKMLSWEPAIRGIVQLIIDGLWTYSNITKRYTFEEISETDVEVHVRNMFPLPEDEQELKRSDLESVQAHTMSKRTFMKKWYGMSENEAIDEFERIMEEIQYETEASVSTDGDGNQIGQKYTYKYDYDGKGNNSIKEGLNLRARQKQRDERKDDTEEEKE